MFHQLSAIIVFALLTLSPTVSADDPSSVLKTLKGVWEIDSGVNQGEPLTDDELEGSKVLITEDSLVTYDKDERELYRATFEIDATEKPVQINMTTAMKGAPKSKAYGILRVKDDGRWLLCYAMPGGERPEEFASPKGSSNMLFMLSRPE